MKVSPWNTRSFGTRFAIGIPHLSCTLSSLSRAPVAPCSPRKSVMHAIIPALHSQSHAARTPCSGRTKKSDAHLLFQERQHGFHQIRAGRSRESGTSVTGIGCVTARPATVPRLPATSRGDNCRMPIASTRPGYRRAIVAYVVGSLCPSSPIRMNFISGKISHQLFGILEFVLHSGRNERFRARIEVAQ